MYMYILCYKNIKKTTRMIVNYSPNFSTPSRNINKIKYIVFHYTGMRSENKAINRLLNVKSKVSCHYFIKKNGEIINMVPDRFIAWHAGVSYWKNYKNLNNISIGIEIQNSGHINRYEKFSIKQIKSLLFLTKTLKKKYNIKSKNFLGHSDIAPYRKKDPGEKFPWNKLYHLNLSFNPNKMKFIEVKKIRSWFKRNAIYSKKKKILIMLNIIGYDISKSIDNEYYYKILITNYRNHFFQKRYYKNSKLKLINFIELHCCNFLLTKI